jgi:Meiosis protein SPO22/ZIP4 like
VEHFFASLDLKHARGIPTVAEIMIDLFFDIGKGLLSQGCCDMAVQWLKRAFELLQDHDLGKLSPDAGELRLNVLHTYG